MRVPTTFLSMGVLGVMLLATPAVADTAYSNGPINGNLYAWTINFGFAVSDTFTLTDFNSLTGLAFGAWLFPGDTLQSVEVSITSDEFGGTTYFDQFVNVTQSGCNTNQFGYSVCTETGNFDLPFMNPGTYWVNLQNASVPSGDPVYWDENFGGPASHALGQSLASENTLGTIPSEAFSIFEGATTFQGSSTTPEPDTIVLLCSGALTLYGSWRLRRRSRRGF